MNTIKNAHLPQIENKEDLQTLAENENTPEPTAEEIEDALRVRKEIINELGLFVL